MENNKKLGKYSNEDVLKVVSKLPEVERDNLLAKISIADTATLLNMPTEEFEQWCEQYSFGLWYSQMLLETIKKLNRDVDGMLLDEVKEFSIDYDKLNDSEKEHVTVALLNNDEFKKNCFNILERNFKKLINSDEVMVTLDKAFGLSKIYKKCLDMGRKSDYTYEV